MKFSKESFIEGATVDYRFPPLFYVLPSIEQNTNYSSTAKKLETDAKAPNNFEKLEFGRLVSSLKTGIERTNPQFLGKLIDDEINNGRFFQRA